MRKNLGKNMGKNIYKFVKKIYRYFWERPLWNLFGILPINKKKLVFDNFLGKGYGGNPKYIGEEILKQDLDWKLIWVVKDLGEVFPKGIQPVKYGSLKAFYHYATAKVWIDNVRNTIRPKKRKGQIYLQTWHGSMGLKMGEGEVEEKLSPKYVETAKYDGSICDGILVGNQVQKDCFKRYFWLGEDCEIVESGLPYNDCFFDPEYVMDSRNKVRKFFGIQDREIVVLYAPTFRDDGSIKGYHTDLEQVLEAFERKTGKKCRGIVTLHPNAVKQEEFIGYNHRILNGTPYEDVQELCCGADYLITDYSSVSVDFSLLRKPVFLYGADLEEYQKLRGLTSIFYEVPFPLAESKKALIQNIMNYEEKEYEKKVEDFYKKHKSFEKGTGAKEAVSWIKNKL